MPRFFRSQQVEVGDRVVVRRVLHDYPGKVGDIIGHVVGLEPLVVRPQKVGGWPSDADPITVPDKDVLIVRRMPPRTIRTSDIRAVEVAIAASHPGTADTWSADEQWYLRYHPDGDVQRNSAIPLGPSAGFTAVPLEEIAAFYAAHGQQARVAIPERLGRGVEKLARSGGWELSEEELVFTRQLDVVSPAAQVEGYHLHLTGPGLAQVLDIEDTPVATGQLHLTETPDGDLWLGISDLEVATAHRRLGLASWLSATALSWAASEGAQRAFWQSPESWDAATALASRLGFVEHHRRRYAIAPTG